MDCTDLDKAADAIAKLIELLSFLTAIGVGALVGGWKRNEALGIGAGFLTGAGMLLVGLFLGGMLLAATHR